MKKTNDCGVCGQPRSKYVMNNKPVCLKCDDLLFDLEIECEETEAAPSADRRQTTVPTKTKTINVVKKS